MIWFNFFVKKADMAFNFTLLGTEQMISKLIDFSRCACIELSLIFKLVFIKSNDTSSTLYPGISLLWVSFSLPANALTVSHPVNACIPIRTLHTGILLHYNSTVYSIPNFCVAHQSPMASWKAYNYTMKAQYYNWAYNVQPENSAGQYITSKILHCHNANDEEKNFICHQFKVSLPWLRLYCWPVQKFCSCTVGLLNLHQFH